MKDGRLVCIYAYICRAEHGGRIVRRGRSGKQAASIFVLAYALRALILLLGRVDGGF